MKYDSQHMMGCRDDPWMQHLYALCLDNAPFIHQEQYWIWQQLSACKKHHHKNCWDT